MKLTFQIATYVSVILIYIFLFFSIIRSIIWNVIFIYDPTNYYFFEKVLFALGLGFSLAVTHQILFQKKEITLVQKIIYISVYTIYVLGPLFMRPVEIGSYNLGLRDLLLLNLTPGFLPVAIYNISLFFPLGFIKKINFFSYLILVLFLELVQYVTGLGAFDMVDILIYTVGYVSARLINHGIYQKKLSTLVLGVILPISFLLFIIFI